MNVQRELGFDIEEAVRDSTFDLEINGNIWILEKPFKISYFKISGNLETSLIMAKEKLMRLLRA